MAPKGVELASAYVSLGANTKDLADAISDVFDDFGVEAEKAGKDAGKKIGKGFDSAKGSARRAGRESASAFSSSFSSGVQSTRIGGALSRIGGEAKASGNKAGFIAGKAMGAGITAGLTVAAAGAAVAVAGIGAALTGGFKRLRTIDSAKFKLEALGHSAEGIEKIMKSAEKSVTGTAFGLGEAATVAASAVAAGIKPGEELTGYLSLVADTAAIAGTSFEEMATIFNKVQTSNKAYTDDLRQLADRGIPVFQLLQREYGVTAEELDKMVQDGKVSAADLQKVLQSKLGGAAQKMGESFEGSIANAKAALSRVGEAFLEPVFGEAAGGVNGVKDALDDLTAWIKGNRDSIIDFWVVLGEAAVTATYQVVLGVADITGALADLVGGLGNTLGAMTKFNSGVQRLLGRDDIADQLLEDAEEYYSWGEGLRATSDRARELAESISELRPKIQGWGEDAKAAGDKTGEASEKFEGLGTSIMAARGEAEQGIDVPVEVDTSQAESQMDGFLSQYSKMVISPEVGKPGTGGSTGGSSPWDGFSFPDGGDTGGALSPQNQAIQDYLRNDLGFTGEIGGYRGSDGYNEHSSGRASDVMVRSAAEGNAMLPNVLQREGVEYVLWNQQQYFPDGRVVPMPDRGDPTQNHMDHLHVKTFDKGGWWKDGELGINTTGEDEFVLNPDHLDALKDGGVDPAALVEHGASQGAPIGPQGGQNDQLLPDDPAGRADALGRTEGFLPVAAQNLAAVGEGGLSSIFDLGESLVHNLVDTGAQLASMAATAAISAGSFGAGAAAGPAASTAISMGAEAAKRGISYGYDLAGIWGEALVEQLSPFGAPRWLGTPLPTGINMPQIPGEAPGELLPDEMQPEQPGGEGEQPRSAAELAKQWAQPDPADAATGTAQDGVAPKPAMPDGTSALELVNGMGIPGLSFDNGGILQPNSAAINLSSQPEAIFTQKQLGEMANGNAMSTKSRSGDTNNFYSQDLDGMFREYEKQKRREARTYSGRP